MFFGLFKKKPAPIPLKVEEEPRKPHPLISASELQAKLDEHAVYLVKHYRQSIADHFFFGCHPYKNLRISGTYNVSCCAEGNSEIDALKQELSALGYEVKKKFHNFEGNKVEYRIVQIKKAKK